MGGAQLMPAVTLTEDGLQIRVFLQPKASRDQIIGRHGDEVKIAITSPPVEGKANKHLVKYLAKCFGVAKSHVHFVRGELSRHKTLHITHPQKIPPVISALQKEPE